MMTPTISPVTRSIQPTVVQTAIPTVSPTVETISPTLAAVTTDSPTFSPTPVDGPPRVIPITPFQLTFTGVSSPSETDYDIVQDIILEHLARFMFTQFSFNLDFDFDTVDGSIVETNGNTVTFDMDALFGNTGRLFPTSDGVDVLTSTAFSRPTITELITLLANGGGAFAETTDVEYTRIS